MRSKDWSTMSVANTHTRLNLKRRPDADPGPPVPVTSNASPPKIRMALAAVAAAVHLNLHLICREQECGRDMRRSTRSVEARSSQGAKTWATPPAMCQSLRMTPPAGAVRTTQPAGVRVRTSSMQRQMVTTAGNPPLSLNARHVAGLGADSPECRRKWFPAITASPLAVGYSPMKGAGQ